MACKDRDGGVSEVVSALLMVAVVVALAAIAGSMVFGIGLPEEPRTLVVTATRSGDVITFTNHGGMNMDKVAEIRCWIGGVGQGNKDIELETWAGATKTYTSKEAVRVVVVGTFVDGESWIVLDKTV